MANTQEPMQAREQMIIRTSVLGIVANIILTVFKIVVGLLANSIAVVLDAINNLSDALSSVITILGTKLAGKKPDKKHPMGYGRIEYLSTMIVSAIVLYAGITSMTESVKKIVSPEESNYSIAAIVIIASAVVVKLILGRYVSHMGKKVHSGALTASGSDALFDAVLSFSVLVCALIHMWLGWNLEAYVGVLISIVIIKAGIDMMMEAVDEVLGKRVDREYLKEIRKTIQADPEVLGAYDLILHSYGPDQYIGSVHVEIQGTMSAAQIDHMERRIAERVYSEHGVILAGIGIYATDSNDHDIRNQIVKVVLRHEGVLQVHGFFLDREKKMASLDVILDFELDDREKTYQEIVEDVKQSLPEWNVHIALDIDF